MGRMQSDPDSMVKTMISSLHTVKQIHNYYLIISLTRLVEGTLLLRYCHFFNL